MLSGIRGEYSHKGNLRLTLVDINGFVVQERIYYDLIFADDNSIIQDNAGNLLIACTDTARNYNLNMGVRLMKTDSLGNPIWKKSIDHIQRESPLFLSVTKYGDYLLAGNRYMSGDQITYFYLYKLTNAGNVQWVKWFGFADTESLCSLETATDGTYLLGGKIFSSESKLWELFVLRTNSSGDSIWAKIYSHPGGDDFAGMCVIPDGFAIATTDAAVGQIRLIIQKKNKTTEKVYFNKQGNRCVALTKTAENGFILLGSEIYQRMSDSSTMHFFSTDAKGKQLYERWKSWGTFCGYSFARLVKKPPMGFILIGIRDWDRFEIEKLYLP